MAGDCKTITITKCPPSYGCDECLEIIKASCIDWEGHEPLTGISEVPSEGCDCVPQACVKLKGAGSAISEQNSIGFYKIFFSCSTTNLPDGCTKTYKIFDNWEQEVFAGTLQQCYARATATVNGLVVGLGYTIVEYITCEDGSTESASVCFEVKSYPFQQTQTRRVQASCKCCSTEVVSYNATLDPLVCGECRTIDFSNYFDTSGNVIIAEIEFGQVDGGEIDYESGYSAEFCAEAGFTGDAHVQFRLIDINGYPLSASFRTLTIPIECFE